MTFYIVLFSDDGSPEGIGYEFAKNKREAVRVEARIKQDTREFWEEKMSEEENDEIAVKSYKDMIRSDLASIKIEEIKIPNKTVKQQIYWALQYQVIS